MWRLGRMLKASRRSIPGYRQIEEKGARKLGNLPKILKINI